MNQESLPEWERRLTRYEEEHEKRLAKYQEAHEKRLAEWDKLQKDFAQTMHGFQIRAESDMQTIREDLHEITSNIKLLTRMMTGSRGNGKEGEQP